MQSFSWAYGEREETVEGDGHAIAFISEGRRGWLRIEKPSFQLEVASLQAFINDLVEQNPLAKVDYIHGEGSLENFDAISVLFREDK